MSGVPMDTETFRGVKKYRLREIYERGRAKCKRIRDLFGFRSTPALEQRLSERKEKTQTKASRRFFPSPEEVENVMEMLKWSRGSVKMLLPFALSRGPS